MLGSLASLGFTRLPLLGSTLGLETRYIGDALLPGCVVIGVAICPLVGETHPYRMPANLAVHWQRYGPVWWQSWRWAQRVACVGGLASTYEYRRYVTDSPTREFLSTAKHSVADLPPGGQIYDTNLPAPLLGAHPVRRLRPCDEIRRTPRHGAATARPLPANDLDTSLRVRHNGSAPADDR